MTPLTLGIPAPAHREVLLRETAWAGRPACAWHDGRGWRPLLSLGLGSRAEPVALVLHDDTDPEAGAMGLARLAWVAADGRPARWGGADRLGVTLVWGQFDGERTFSASEVPTLRDATSAEHAIGLVCQHLGLLDGVVLPTAT